MEDHATPSAVAWESLLSSVVADRSRMADTLRSLASVTDVRELSSRLDWLLVTDCYEAACEVGGASQLLRSWSAAAPQSMCTTSFTFGDVIWKCRCEKLPPAAHHLL